METERRLWWFRWKGCRSRRLRGAGEKVIGENQERQFLLENASIKEYMKLRDGQEVKVGAEWSLNMIKMCFTHTRFSKN